MTPKWYNYGVLMCYALFKTQFFKRTKTHIIGVEEFMIQLVGLPIISRVNGGNMTFRTTKLITSGLKRLWWRIVMRDSKSYWRFFVVSQ